MGLAAIENQASEVRVGADSQGRRGWECEVRMWGRFWVWKSRMSLSRCGSAAGHGDRGGFQFSFSVTLSRWWALGWTCMTTAMKAPRERKRWQEGSLQLGVPHPHCRVLFSLVIYARGMEGTCDPLLLGPQMPLLFSGCKNLKQRALFCSASFPSFLHGLQGGALCNEAPCGSLHLYLQLSSLSLNVAFTWKVSSKETEVYSLVDGKESHFC